MNFNFLTENIEKHPSHYEFVSDSMRELQPLAFLLSASLILAAFFDQNTISQNYALFASLTFFLAYLGFVVYKKINYAVLFYWSLSLLFVGFYLLYRSFGGILQEVLYGINDKGLLLIAFLVIYSIPFLLSKYYLDMAHIGHNWKKRANMALYLFILFFVVIYSITIFFDITPIFMIISSYLAILIFFVSLIICYGSSHKDIPKN